jgi:hypothetical protein
VWNGRQLAEMLRRAWGKFNYRTHHMVPMNSELAAAIEIVETDKRYTHMTWVFQYLMQYQNNDTYTERFIAMMEDDP